MNDIERHLQQILTEHAKDIEKEAQGKTKILRFGRDRVTPHDIETTHYCEKKHDFLYNLVAIEKTLAPIQRDVLARNIEGVEARENEGTLGHEVAALSFGHVEEIPVKAIYNDVLISGRVDSLIAAESSVIVVERKFRKIASLPKKDIPKYNKPYPEAIAQARSYCFCLSAMLCNCGFSSSIGYEVRYYPKECRDCERMFSPSCNVDTCQYASFWLTYPYDFNNNEMVECRRQLDFALAYWLNKRNAKPTVYASKWDSCEYRSLCNLCKGGR
jgi:hypothetical protein